MVMALSEVVRSNAQRTAALVKWTLDRERRRRSSPVSSMRSFWGLLLAYWLSERWREAWGLTFLILLLTGLSAQASVWFALTSGELVNRIANFHHPTVPTTPSSLLSTAGTLAAIAITRDAGFTAVRHFSRPRSTGNGASGWTNASTGRCSIPTTPISTFSRTGLVPRRRMRAHRPTTSTREYRKRSRA